MFSSLLQDHILNLTDELELRRIREAEQQKSHEYEKQQIIEDIEGLRVGNWTAVFEGLQCL